MILGAIDRVMQAEALKSESVTVDYDELQVEHLIPQSWREYWPVSALDASARLVAEQDRDGHVNRIGNLTLANDRLNPAMSNDPWNAKRSELRKHSKLELNARLVTYEQWGEASIRERGRLLAAAFDQVWPGPDSRRWEPPSAGSGAR